eukprot:1193077-Pyramimonas_sp.AAC.1
MTITWGGLRGARRGCTPPWGREPRTTSLAPVKHVITITTWGGLPGAHRGCTPPWGRAPRTTSSARSPCSRPGTGSAAPRCSRRSIGTAGTAPPSPAPRTRTR